MRFTGDRASRDSKLIWQVAQLVERGKLAEGVAIDAAGAPSAIETYPDKPVGYFRSCLNRAVGTDELKALLKGVRLQRGYALEPEANGSDLDALITEAAEATAGDVEGRDDG